MGIPAARAARTIPDRLVGVGERQGRDQIGGCVRECLDLRRVVPLRLVGCHQRGGRIRIRARADGRLEQYRRCAAGALARSSSTNSIARRLAAAMRIGGRSRARRPSRHSRATYRRPARSRCRGCAQARGRARSRCEAPLFRARARAAGTRRRRAGRCPGERSAPSPSRHRSGRGRPRRRAVRRAGPWALIVARLPARGGARTLVRTGAHAYALVHWNFEPFVARFYPCGVVVGGFSRWSSVLLVVAAAIGGLVAPDAVAKSFPPRWPQSPGAHAAGANLAPRGIASPAYAANLRGGFAIVGNTLLTCPENLVDRRRGGRLTQHMPRRRTTTTSPCGT